MSPVASAPGLSRVVSRFRTLRAGIRGLFLGYGLSWFLLAAGLYAVVTFALDFVFALPDYVRLTFLTAGVAGAAWLLWRRLIRPLAVRITDDDLALFVERHHPELNDRLISAIQLSRRPEEEVSGTAHFNSPELVDALVQEVDEVAGRIEFRRILMADYVVRVGAFALVLAAGLTALAVWKPVYAGIYVRRAVGMNVRWPQKIRLRVLDFDESRRKVVERGREKFTIRVRVEKLATVRTPDEVTITHRVAGGDPKDEAMTPAGDDCFDYTFDRVPGPFSFRVKGGDDETEEYFVDTLTPPSLDWLHLLYEYPRYLKMKDTPEDAPVRVGHVSAPVYTKVRLKAESREPLREAWLAIGPKGREKVEPMALEGGHRISGEFTVTDTYGEYEIRLVATNTLPNREPLRYSIHGLEDKKPEFKFVDPVVESEDVSEICDRPIVFEARDDHGIEEVGIEYQVRGERTTEWRKMVVTSEMFGRREDGERQARGDRKILVTAGLDFSKVELPGPDNTAVRIKPGDHVYVRFRASDYKDIGGRNVEVSREIHFSVKSVAEIERALTDEIDRIKRILGEQKRKQEEESRLTDDRQRKLGGLDTLTADQQGEIRQRKLEQSSIADKLVTTRTDIARVMRRGVYNRVFNDTAAAKLQGAVDILTELVGDPNRREKYGAALSAVQSLEEAGAARASDPRKTAFEAARDFQLETSKGIQRALDMLEKWANYQEVIRITREILDIVKKMNKTLQGK